MRRACLVMVVLGFGAGFGLGGCSGTGGETTQAITVTTVPAGADCALYRRDALVARIKPTPGLAVMEKTTDALTIVCSRPGFAPTRYVNQPVPQEQTLTDRMTAMLGQGSDAANVLYASPVNLRLTPLPPPPAAAKPARIPYGALQPPPPPMPTTRVDSAPVKALPGH